ncbi:para-nitrobenzyl esterase [Leucobacter exalbidus]|uniref:Carboxylic ester hydrolase n=1 Tax=Leucobacter exalbidus TaxID=662960 RepID=A0A940PT40_9MICO|nr:carboxylesterase family protein [Leucobacter exalbidus]MBP1326337.1 para-nitrobenzyl esterase [Leucobacter exalbidus]
MTSTLEFFGGEITAPATDGIFDARGVQYAQLSEANRPFSLAELSTPRQTSPACFPQNPGGLDFLLGSALSDLEQTVDAFHLRIQGPVRSHDAPVIVFVPGGGFLSGSGSSQWYAGGQLSRGTEAIVVTVNYRIGAWGFLGDGPGAELRNQGLHDVMLALRWVQRYITAFGGDPENVTLAGDSAGGWIAQALATATEAKGLFRRVLLVSPPGDAPFDEAAYRERSSAFVAALEVSPQEATTSDVLSAQQQLVAEYRGRGMPVFPVIDDGLVSTETGDACAFGKNAHVSDVLVVTTSDEGQAFVAAAPDAAFTEVRVEEAIAATFNEPERVAVMLQNSRKVASAKQRMGDVITLEKFRLPAMQLAESAAAAGIPASLVRVHDPVGLALGAPHCFAVPLLFGNREQWQGAPMLEGMPREVFEQMSDELISMVRIFVSGGQDVEPNLRRETRELGVSPTTRIEPDSWIKAKSTSSAAS